MDTYCTKRTIRSTSRQKYSRVNADSLVHLQGSRGRNYNASGSITPSCVIGRAPSSSFLPSLGHGTILSRSMFVVGLLLDTIEAKTSPAFEGIIPPDWFELGGWTDTRTVPPERLWRTLVADGGQDGANPPTYYSRALQHALAQTVQGGSLNTQAQIAKGGSTVVVKFLQRLQAVVWTRRLIRTKCYGFLGLVPRETKKEDLICIIHGCSIPVVLRVDGSTCHNCQHHRTPCDGIQPRCSACEGRSTQCVYQSKRTTAAYSRCRHRKTRCDGIKPLCS